MADKLKGKFLTLTEFRKKVGIPLVWARHLVIRGEVKAIRAKDGSIRITESEAARLKEFLKHPRGKVSLFLKTLGPGLITGASDDDPSGIGTYSSVGAHFGFNILWMAAYLLPIMMAIQEVCARIGIVTRKGLAGVLLEHYRRKVVMGIVLLLIVANVVNIGADIGAMAASLEMLTHCNISFAAIFFAVLIVLCEIYIPYHLYVKVLKWLTLSVFAYIITGFIVKPDWSNILGDSFIPQIIFNEEYIFAMIAVFGTSITPYLFFWQASEEVEEGKLTRLGLDGPAIHRRIRLMRTDVAAGMILANVVFYFIVLTSAQVLFRNGITEIESAEQAAQALKPLAGQYAYLLFACGIIGTGLLAIPVLAGSGAYALAELMGWKEGLEHKFNQAKAFYLVIASSVMVGLALNFLGINPITALYYSAYLNGIIALPLLVVIMVVGNDARIMGEETNPKWVSSFGWLSVVFMSLAVLVSLFFLLRLK
jgi:NRAMP (natural resistance-associated macrophage protein)-like metal ion transporter